MEEGRREREVGKRERGIERGERQRETETEGEREGGEGAYGNGGELCPSAQPAPKTTFYFLSDTKLG